jgi:hypothetical protein
LKLEVRIFARGTHFWVVHKIYGAVSKFSKCDRPSVIRYVVEVVEEKLALQPRTTKTNDDDQNGAVFSFVCLSLLSSLLYKASLDKETGLFGKKRLKYSAGEGAKRFFPCA